MLRTKKGFTLIELMIVIAIISIIAAIAIPNLVQSRIRANEAAAVSALKAYATAQVTFQSGKQGSVTGNAMGSSEPTAFTANFRNLYYGEPRGGASGSLLELISQAHADANALTASPTGVGEKITPPLSEIPYAGYQFAEPADLASAASYKVKFGNVAVPAESGSTGNNTYWIGVQGVVYQKGLASGAAANASATVTPTPSSGTIPADWLSL